MTSSLLKLATIACPHCRASNAIITGILSLDSRVACSRCKSEIGRWRDLVGNAKTIGPGARQA